MLDEHWSYLVTYLCSYVKDRKRETAVGDSDREQRAEVIQMLEICHKGTNEDEALPYHRWGLRQNSDIEQGSLVGIKVGLT